METAVLITVRSGSTRLPGKALIPIYRDVPLLEHIINRAKKSKLADKIIVCTTILDEDDKISKIAEKYDTIIDYRPKPYANKNGSGCHNNFSTETTRNKNGIKEIYNYINKLETTHQQHLELYGEDNEKRLTGIHETSSFEKFSWGIGTRSTSVRIPIQVFKDGCGYFEDRRPASNIDPYLTTSILFKTCCID